MECPLRAIAAAILLRRSESGFIVKAKVRQQLRNRYAERICESSHRVKGYVPFSALHGTHVVPMQIAKLGEAVLCDSLRPSERTQVVGEGLTQLAGIASEICIGSSGDAHVLVGRTDNHRVNRRECLHTMSGISLMLQCHRQVASLCVVKVSSISWRGVSEWSVNDPLDYFGNSARSKSDAVVGGQDTGGVA